MTKRGPWHDGHRAWQQLTAWHDRRAAGRQPAADDGEAALEAMADIGVIRRLLDQAELVAVRTARRHRRSWAEIATQLGITRQSAWERWRDLDEPAGDSSGESPGGSPAEAAAADALEAAAGEMAEQLVGELTAREARAQRRRSKVVVPNVVGMTWDDARHALLDRGLVAASPDPDGPPLAALGWPNTVVVDQVPESGAKVPAGTPVRLWLERGGGSAGVREPRRPKPAPKSGYEWRDEPADDLSGEPSDEAVG